MIKHYAVDPERFAQHALRTLSNGKGAILSQKGKNTQPNAIIIGSGLSGLSAALTLVDRGAKVVIIEKQPFMGGNSAYASSGINAARQPSDESIAERRKILPIHRYITVQHQMKRIAPEVTGTYLRAETQLAALQPAMAEPLDTASSKLKEDIAELQSSQIVDNG